MIKGKHSGEFCRLQARISILCRCCGEMACFRKTMTHTLPLPAAHRHSLALSDSGISSYAYFHLTKGLWDSDIFQLSHRSTETHVAAAADLSVSCFRAPSGLIHLPAAQNIDISLLKWSFLWLFLTNWEIWDHWIDRPGHFFCCCFCRQMTSQRLLIRLKTFPRKTQRGSDWWSSPRARMIPWQPSVGQSSLLKYHFNGSSVNFGPFWKCLAFTSPSYSISELLTTALNRCSMAEWRKPNAISDFFEVNLWYCYQMFKKGQLRYILLFQGIKEMWGMHKAGIDLPSTSNFVLDRLQSVLSSF